MRSRAGSGNLSAARLQPGQQDLALQSAICAPIDTVSPTTGDGSAGLRTSANGARSQAARKPSSAPERSGAVPQPIYIPSAVEAMKLAVDRRLFGTDTSVPFEHKPSQCKQAAREGLRLEL
jgi:hypothetical protein